MKHSGYIGVASRRLRILKTKSTLLSFMLAMTVYPDVFKKAQAEIDRVVGSERLPQPEDRANLPYVESVILEVLR